VRDLSPTELHALPREDLVQRVLELQHARQTWAHCTEHSTLRTARLAHAARQAATVAAIALHELKTVVEESEDV